jgi:hypothetical protein
MRWLKMRQACEQQNCCPNTMKRYIREDIVVAKQVPAGRRMDWRILESSLPVNQETTVQRAALDALRRARQ